MITRALVVVDVQQEFFGGKFNPVYPPREQTLQRIIEAVDIARQVEMPIVVIEHISSTGGAVGFATNSPNRELHPDLEDHIPESSPHLVKQFPSAFDGTGLTDYLKAIGVDTITIVGFTANNCVLATAAAASTEGFAAEVLEDATGSLHLSNSRGSITARDLHHSLMVLLHSNFAAVGSLEDWETCVGRNEPLARDSLTHSAREGAFAFDDVSEAGDVRS